MNGLLSSFWPRLTEVSYNLFLAICLLTTFWLLGSLASRVIRRIAQTSDDHRCDVLRLLASTAKTICVVFGIITALGTMQVNVAALVAGLGLTGFALGFAFRDALSNLLAGMMILFYQPFQRNDRILVAGFEGTVRQIDLRYTTIEVHDGRALIPNSTLLNSPVHVIEEE